MKNEPDSLDDLVRRGANTVPVPVGLEERIRAGVARSRRRRFGGELIAAAASILLGAFLFLFVSRTSPVPPSGPVVPLVSASSAPLELRESQFTATVVAREDGLVFRFVKGGPTHE